MIRTFTRPQNVLRTFFGLGPEELGLEDVMLPILDVGYLATSFQEQQIITANSAAVAPGAAGLASVAWPARGAWMVDAWSVSTTGPVTSGFCTVAPAMRLVRAGNIMQFGFVDHTIRLDKFGAQTVRVGSPLRPPLVFWSTPDFADVIDCPVLNDAASVGTVTITIQLLARQLELGF